MREPSQLLCESAIGCWRLSGGARGRSRMRPAHWRGLCAVPVILLLLVVAGPAQAAGRSASYPLASPDKTIRVRFDLVAGAPSYRVAHNRRPLLASSGLGLQFR